MQCQKLKTYMETGRVVFLPVKVESLLPIMQLKFLSNK